MNCIGVSLTGKMLGSTGHSRGYLRTKSKILTTMDQIHKVERTIRIEESAMRPKEIQRWVYAEEER